MSALRQRHSYDDLVQLVEGAALDSQLSLLHFPEHEQHTVCSQYFTWASSHGGCVPAHQCLASQQLLSLSAVQVGTALPALIRMVQNSSDLEVLAWSRPSDTGEAEAEAEGADGPESGTGGDLAKLRLQSLAMQLDSLLADEADLGVGGTVASGRSAMAEAESFVHQHGRTLVGQLGFMRAALPADPYAEWVLEHEHVETMKTDHVKQLVALGIQNRLAVVQFLERDGRAECKAQAIHQVETWG